MLGTIQEIEDFSKRVIDGDVDPLELAGLHELDMWAVLSIAHIYSLVKLGTMSQKNGAKLVFKVLNRMEFFKTRIYFHEKIYSRQVEATKLYSDQRTELVKAMRENKSIGECFVIMARLLDLLTHEDIYFIFAQKLCKDQEGSKKPLNTACANVDKYIEQFGNDIPYARLLERFYSVTVKDGIAQVFKELDTENLVKRARAGLIRVPVKDESSGKQSTQAFEKIYDQRRV